MRAVGVVGYEGISKGIVWVWVGGDIPMERGESRHRGRSEE